ncbi:hypothetical protein QBC38DRAFT_548703 [Podospora fimiseda]|uniref:Uncharacterized protein n=1 Tax=Podospora fimiseda TaxID=252190 RepID=A0AAN7BGX6_9PEZI|nr:hypothetical protein QBC38DRAFT_548703 [Podospora fimiseda]
MAELWNLSGLDDSSALIPAGAGNLGSGGDFPEMSLDAQLKQKSCLATFLYWTRDCKRILYVCRAALVQERRGPLIASPARILLNVTDFPCYRDFNRRYYSGSEEDEDSPWKFPSFPIKDTLDSAPVFASEGGLDTRFQAEVFISQVSRRAQTTSKGQGWVLEKKDTSSSGWGLGLGEAVIVRGTGESEGFVKLDKMALAML